MRPWIVLTLLLLPAPTRAQECALVGVASVPRVRIEPTGGSAFEIDLVDHPLEARAEGDRVRVHSRSTFDFTGTAAAVPVALRRATTVGPLLLRPGTPLLEPALVGAGVRVRAELSPNVSVRLDLRCDGVRAGATAEPPDEAPDAIERGDLLAEGAHLRVHDSPAGPTSLVLARIGEGGLLLAELERRGDWVRVRRDFATGATLDGWVRARDVRRVPSEEVHDYLMGTLIGVGGCGRGGSDGYDGPATVRAGALVHHQRASWARARRDVEVQVHWPAGGEWVRLETIEGVRAHGSCPNLLDVAWVRRSDVRLPTDR